MRRAGKHLEMILDRLVGVVVAVAKAAGGRVGVFLEGVVVRSRVAEERMDRERVGADDEALLR